MKTNDCDHERIHSFLAADHDQPDSVLIDQLEQCEDCRAYFDAQIASTDQWKHVGQLLKPDEHDHATRLDFSAGSDAGHQARQSASINDVLNVLAPTDDPHCLGRMGSYEVTGVIGAGGMGVVLKAFEPSLDRVVAIKVLAPHLAHNEKARQRFEREARAAAAVINPNVIPIYSVASDGKLPYLAMACIQGGSLQQRLDSQGAASVPEVLRIGSQIASGLAAAHEQGLVHRDIKPENILFEGDVERVSITDFGLARAVDDNTVTQAGTIAGTPMYMSPEQARGEKVDQQSDLFSLGSVLYALCTGEPPYCADSSLGVMRKITDESPTPIRELNPDTPEWLADIIEKLMAREKTARFALAAEVRDLLENCLSHVQAPDTVTLPEQLQPCRASGKVPTKLRPAFGIGGLLIGLLAAVFFIVTNNGVVRVEVLDESFQVAIDGRTLTVTEEGNAQPIQLRVGEHNLTVKVGEADFVTSNFEIRRNGEVAFRVEPLDGKVLVSRDGTEVASKAMRATSPPENPNEEGDRPHTAESSTKIVQKALADLPSSETTSGKHKLESRAIVTSADKLAKSGDLKAATDAYLGAYRTYPSSLESRHVDTFIKAGRITALGECINDTGNENGMFNEYVCRETIKALLGDARTQQLGHRLLKNYFRLDESCHSNVLSYPENYGIVWQDVPDLIFFFRTAVIPTDFQQEGAGWERFSVDTFSEQGEVRGLLTRIIPLCFDKNVLLQFTKELRTLTLKHRAWKGGRLLLAVLEAELGHFDKAEAIVNEHFVGRNAPTLPAANGWILGLALEGRNEELDHTAIELYEYALKVIVADLTDFEGTGEFRAESLRSSPLKNLAYLYAKYGRRAEARTLLYGLVDMTDQHPLVRNYRPGVFGSCSNGGRCNACHCNEMNTYDYEVLSTAMTDIGYPVDSFVSLARIDASFGNAYTSSGGVSRKHSAEKQTLYERLKYQKSPGATSGLPSEMKRAAKLVTPQLVVEALDLDTLRPAARFSTSTYDDIRDPQSSWSPSELRYFASTLEPEERTSGVIDLMLSVRHQGPDGTPEIVSPVIELLKLAANFDGPNTKKEIADLDARLRLQSEVNPNDIQAAVAATVFAFLRNDTKVVNDRLKRLQGLALSSKPEDQLANTGLWLVARQALRHDSTKAFGEALAAKALASAEKLSDPNIKKAIIGERAVIEEGL